MTPAKAASGPVAGPPSSGRGNAGPAPPPPGPAPGATATPKASLLALTFPISSSPVRLVAEAPEPPPRPPHGQALSCWSTASPAQLLPTPDGQLPPQRPQIFRFATEALGATVPCPSPPTQQIRPEEPLRLSLDPRAKMGSAQECECTPRVPAPISGEERPEAGPRCGLRVKHRNQGPFPGDGSTAAGLGFPICTMGTIHPNHKNQRNVPMSKPGRQQLRTHTSLSSQQVTSWGRDWGAHPCPCPCPCLPTHSPGAAAENSLQNIRGRKQAAEKLITTWRKQSDCNNWCIIYRFKVNSFQVSEVSKGLATNLGGGGKIK